MTQLQRNTVDLSRFNQDLDFPYQLRLQDFQLSMQDIYDFFFDVNSRLTERSLSRLDDMMRPAGLSGLVSDMLTSSLARHARALTENQYPNGHPDLILSGRHPNNAVQSGIAGVEVKATRKPGGAVDTHGAREQWLCVFVHRVDNETEPASERKPLTFTEVYLGQVVVDDFRRNPRGELGTRTATLHKDGIRKLRESWVYKLS